MPVPFALSRASSHIADSHRRAALRNSASICSAKGEVSLVSSSGDLARKPGQGEAAAYLQTADWSYSSGENDDHRIAEAFSRCADNIALLPRPGAEAARRRPQLVHCFEGFGLLPDYQCNLTELDPGACAPASNRVQPPAR